MKISAIVSVVLKYDRSLTRYIRLFTKNEQVAASISMKAIEQYYDQQHELEAEELRHYLLVKTRALCWQWVQDHVQRLYKPTNSSLKISYYDHA